MDSRMTEKSDSERLDCIQQRFDIFKDEEDFCVENESVIWLISSLKTAWEHIGTLESVLKSYAKEINYIDGRYVYKIPDGKRELKDIPYEWDLGRAARRVLEEYEKGFRAEPKFKDPK